jgi:predicted transcriptional regulator
MTKHITVELSDAQKAQLDEIARHEDMPPEALIVDLVKARLDYEERFRAAVEEGLAQVERGETLSHEEVVARAEARAKRLLGDAGAQ